MRLTRAVLWLMARIVPSAVRARWLEEWRAEMQHGGWRMITGALPDAWEMRRLSGVPAEAGSCGGNAGRHEGPPGVLWLPASAGRKPAVFHGFTQDVRYGFRGLLAAPSFALGVVLSLTVGIGGNIVAFSFINAVVFRPFPGVHAQYQLVRINPGAQEDGRPGFRTFLAATGATAEDGLDLLRRSFTTLSGVSAHYETDLIVSIEGQPFTGPGALVSSNYFDVLGVRPAIGRFFSAADDEPGGEPAVVISHAAWQRLFNEDPAVVGSTMSVNGATVHVIGVASEGFIGVRKAEDKPDVWIPLGLAELMLRDRSGQPVPAAEAHNVYFDYVGRRKPGVTLDRVNAEGAVLAAQLQLSGSPRLTYSARAMRVWLNDPAKAAPDIVAFMIIPILVLAIACVNAANLLLARATRQARDWAVRLALGASRWRVVRHVLIEATILSLGSAALGLVVAQWAIQLVARQIPVPVPIDYRVAAFTLVTSLTAALAFSLGPALNMLSKAAKRTLTSTAPISAPRSRVRFVLVALQAALSLGLLTTGAQFTNTVFADNPNAATIPAPEQLVLASFDLDPLRMSSAESDVFYERLVSRARQIPGVLNAGLTTPGLVSGVTSASAPLRIWTPGTSDEGSNRFMAVLASPGALETIGVPLVAGRHFTLSDGERRQSVIVNEPFGKKFFNGSALGRTLRVAVGSSPGQVNELTIVGVAGGILKRADSEPPILYHPATFSDVRARVLYVRTDDSERFSAAALHAAVREIDARVPVNSTSTLAQLKDERHREKKLLARGAAALGVLALVLAAGGLYGVVSYVVSLRRQEVGIRLALGAEARSIVVMITRQALTPAASGAALGLFGAAAASKVVQSGLYGASGLDLRAFAGSTALLLSVLSVATILPASRAARVNPVETLRTE